MGTHFSQESLLSSSLQLARKLQLPLVLHIADGKSLERTLELLETEENDSTPVLIHDIVTTSGADANIKNTLISGNHDNLYYIVTGAGITDSDDAVREQARAFLADLPQDKLLVGTDSPWKTPQNLSDTYLRTLRNEPANIESVVQAMSETKGIDLAALRSLLKETSLRVFGMEFIPGRGERTTEVIEEVEDEEEEEEEPEEVAPKKEMKEVKEDKVLKQATKQMKAMKIEKEDEEEESEEEHRGKKKKESKKKDKKEKEKEKSSRAAKYEEEHEEEEVVEKPKKGQKNHSHPKEETVFNPPSATETSNTTATATSTAAAGPSSSFLYKCVKCRNNIFTGKDLTTHALGATKVTTVFKVGEEGLCSSFHFVPAPDGREIHKRLSGLTIRGGNVECSHCGNKLGKFCPAEGICPCGAMIDGPVAKINANKTDAHDQSLDTQALAERSKLELQEVQRENEFKDQEWENQQKLAGGRVKKVKKHKSENRGNFSNFRNKSFIPNASKGKKNEDGTDDNNNEDGEEDLSEHSDS
jgi:hypothetical protein